MVRIAMIGAGSLVFTRRLFTDCLAVPELNCSCFSLMDINAERLKYIDLAIRKVIERTKAKPQIEVTDDLAKAVKGADFVICSIMQGGVQVFRREFDIPAKYGVKWNIGDSMGVAGIFRALRTMPDMLKIARAVEQHAPRAYLLNYTNPMSMLCRYLQRQTQVKLLGLCHSVQGTAEMLAKWLNLDLNELQTLCAGINHQAWFLKLAHRGQNMYPRLRELVSNDQDIWNEERVRNEMFLQLGYYVTESSGHNSEYNPWFRKRDELLEKYCMHGTSWNPGVPNFLVDYHLNKAKTWKQELIDAALGKDNFDLRRSHEYCSYIIEALVANRPFVFNANVPNKGLIGNLPTDCCVEVPVLSDGGGLHPQAVGDLPAELAVLDQIHVAIQEMAVEAAITGDREMIYHACLYDPFTAAVCSMQEIRQMVNDLFDAQREFLPQFTKPR